MLANVEELTNEDLVKSALVFQSALSKRYDPFPCNKFDKYLLENTCDDGDSNENDNDM